MVLRVAAPDVRGAEIVDTGQPVGLHPQEAPMVSKASQQRRRDFALGRACARAALAQLGHGDAVLPIGPDGAPGWPHGTTGSITHTKGYAAALAGDCGRFRAIGLDAERVGGVTDKLYARLFDAAEQAWLAAQADRAVAATFLFCAKEAGIKAWRGVTGKALSFRDIHIEVRDDGFVASAGDDAGPACGRFAAHQDLVLAALCLTAADMAVR